VEDLSRISFVFREHELVPPGLRHSPQRDPLAGRKNKILLQF